MKLEINPGEMRACASLTALLAALSCSAPPPPAAAPPPQAPRAAASRPAPLAVESENGAMVVDATEHAFESVNSAVNECIAQGSARVGALGGHFTIRLKVERDGAVKWAYLQGSTLGDRETEACVLGAVRAASWPKPVGGEGSAEKSFDIEPRVAPDELEQSAQKRALRRLRPALEKCRRGFQGTFVATAYVRANGRVLAAGVAPPNEDGDAAVTCAVDALKRARFVPGAHTGKLTFAFP